MADELKLFGVDRYEMNARLKPGLFTVLPLLILAAAWVPEVWTFLGGLSSLAITCGLTMLMSRIARYRGRKMQEALSERLGSRSTAAALRFRDGRIDSSTKARYHGFLRAVGHALPSKAEEHADPQSADEQYQGCVTWLLERTRDKKKFPLLADENIDYGYRRNMLGLKLFAVPILLICLVVDGAATYAHWTAAGTTIFYKGAAVAVGYALVLGAWVFMVTPRFVADASDAYAIRLLASCDVLPRRSGKTRETAGACPRMAG